MDGVNFNVDANTAGLLHIIRIPIQPGFKGWVAGLQIVNAAYHQLAVIDIYDVQDRYKVATMTFTGQGNRVPMKNAYGHEGVSFGPLSGPAIMHVTILHRRAPGARWIPSKTTGPLTIEKSPEGDVYNKTFYLSVVISEDADDSSQDDCTISVLLYK
ncbi:hypothetical protein CPC08DRAFT_824783 [Agrocybe pediades]|nr:hypothetical protein CPC08DRAFT_824783 [Agrocybe pediades]